MQYGLGKWKILFDPRWCALLPTLIILAISSPVPAADRVLVVADPDRQTHASFIQALHTGNSTDTRLETYSHTQADSVLAASLEPDSRLIITVGTRAAFAMGEALTEHPGPAPPILCTLIPRLSFQMLDHELDWPGKALSAIYLDQPLSRRLKLVRLALPQHLRIGALLGPSSSTLAEKLRSLLPAERPPVIGIVDDANKVLPVLRKVLNNSDILLALADRQVYNTSTAQGILLTTYRHRVPVIGFSKNYVKAGALLAVYSTPGHIARQTADLLVELAGTDTWQLPGTAFPKYFSIAVNRKVARSLNITVRNDDELRAALEAPGE